MIDIVFSPKWFNGIDSVFEGISVIVLILIASYSLKLYKFNKNKNFKDFSIAFFVLAAAFLFKILTNITVYYNVFETYNLGNLIFTISSIKASSIFYNGGYFFFRLLTLFGLYLFITIIDKKETNSMFMIYFIAITTVFSTWAYYIFQLTALLFSGYITYIYFKSYRQRVCDLCDKRVNNIKYPFIAFLTISISNALFIFIKLNTYIYVVAEYIQLIGYIILLYTFIRVLKYGTKKK
ncbi:MAG: hypothetical protein KJ623_02930 [Nanoarchaeota archaeon]|nr:hypothetical protein [Nanoarchaeota archaeon]MBU0963238.1 hypothetical protein [Nanoarchaeota archaeon]